MAGHLHDTQQTREVHGPPYPAIRDPTIMKHTFDYTVRPKLRLGEIERIIRKHRIIVPPLARHTLIKMCEDGTFETVGNAPTRLGWLVYEDSFWRWARAMDEDADGGQACKR